MELHKSVWKEIVATAKRVCPAAMTMPIISRTIAIKCKDGRAIVTSTDIDVFASRDIGECDWPEGAGVVLPVPEIEKLMSVGADFLRVGYLKDYRCEISTGKITRKVHAFSIDEFPEAPTIQDDQSARVDYILRQTLPFVSTDATRVNLCGVYLETLKDGTMQAAATDTHRLTAVPQGGGAPVMDDPEQGIIIPAPAVKYLLSHKESVFLQGTGNKFSRFLVGQWTYTVRLVEGQYPAWRRMFTNTQEGTPHHQRIDVEVWKEACNVFGKLKVKAFEIHPDKAIHYENGESTKIAGDFMALGTPPIAFNTTCLATCLNLTEELGGNTIRMYCDDHEKFEKSVVFGENVLIMPTLI